MADSKSSVAKPEDRSFNLVQFLHEVKVEMGKVSWSDRWELAVYTGVVTTTVFVVCLLIWICDSFFARLFDLILK